MPSYKTAFGSFLKHEDLQGKAIKVTIEEIRQEEINGDHGKEKKLVARFVGKEKGLVLNRTNADSIAEITESEDTDDWSGATIVLYPDKTKFGGKTVDCVRVRAAKGAEPKPKPEPVAVPDYDDAEEPPF